MIQLILAYHLHVDQTLNVVQLAKHQHVLAYQIILVVHQIVDQNVL